MSIQSWGGGLVLLAAAALWVVYLMPSWHARKEYLATERNAIRLQQTLRILAQTAELPDEVRVEMNARSLAEAQRVAASEEARRNAIVRAHEAARQREITRKLAEQEPELERVASVPALTAMRMRRSRLGATIVGFVGIVIAILTPILWSGLWFIALAGIVAAAGSAAVLYQLAQVAKARRARTAPGVSTAPRQRAARRPVAASAAPSSSQVSDFDTEQRSWTPNQIPKPLYVEQPVAPTQAESSEALAVRLRARVAAAAAEAEAAEAAARADAAATAAGIAAGETDPTLARVSRLHVDVEQAAAALSAHDQGRLAERVGLRAAGSGRETAAGRAGAAGLAAAADVERVGMSDGRSSADDDRSGSREGAQSEATSSVAASAASSTDAAVPAAAATPSRWAGMGVIDTESYEHTDLDAVLRRRRAV